MKALFLSLAVLTFSSTVFADRGDDHFREMCQNDEVLSRLGNTGTCNIVTVPSPNVLKGICSGMLMGQIPCTIAYDTTTTSAAVGMRVICGDVASPILDQRMEISSSVYSVNAIIKPESGRSEIQKDPLTYGMIQSGLVMMVVAHSPQGEKAAAIAFVLNDLMNPMSDVVCE